jgi:hypothetical protein
MLLNKSLAAHLMGTALMSLPAFSQEEGGNSQVSVQFSGTFVEGTISNDFRHTASNSGGVLTTYRSSQHEFTAAYVVRFPRRLAPYTAAGTGALLFDALTFTGARAQGRAAFMYGGGADFNLN